MSHQALPRHIASGRGLLQDEICSARPRWSNAIKPSAAAAGNRQTRWALGVAGSREALSAAGTGGGVEVLEPGTNLCGVGMAEVIQNGESLAPGVA